MRKMHRWAAVALLAGTACAPLVAEAARKRPKTPRIEVAVTQEPAPAAEGQPAEIVLSLTPPEGVLLNRYPGIRLAVSESPGLDPGEDEIFVGSPEPIEDQAAAYFETPVPLLVPVVPARRGPDERRLEGTLTFFYCVKKSGFCAPGRQEVSIPVDVAGG